MSPSFKVILKFFTINHLFIYSVLSFFHSLLRIEHDNAGFAPGWFLDKVNSAISSSPREFLCIKNIAIHVTFTSYHIFELLYNYTILQGQDLKEQKTMTT